MEIVTIEQAIADIERIFGLTESTRLHKIGGQKFLFDKQLYPRNMIEEKLTPYFYTHKIKDGGCYVSPITFVFTHVEIADDDRLKELVVNKRELANN